MDSQFPTLDEPRYSQSVERGLAILECFTTVRPTLGISDIAEELGMSRSTTHRYVSTLVALGYLRQDRSRKYSLDVHVTDLGLSALASTELREHSHPLLEDLARRGAFTVGIAILDGPEVVYVDRLAGARGGPLGRTPGSGAEARLPAYCTAAGKLLLAQLPPEELRRTVAEIDFEPRTDSTIASSDDLLSELEQIREDGLAVEDQEFELGAYAIAAPVRSWSREVVAAAVIAAAESVISLDELVGALGPHLVSTADQISARLGYRRKDEIPG